MQTITLLTGQISDIISIAPGTRITSSGNGSIQWTPGSLSDAKNAATWTTWAKGSVAGYMDVVRQMCIRATATGSMTVTIEEGRNDKYGEDAYFEEDTPTLVTSNGSAVLVGANGSWPLPNQYLRKWRIAKSKAYTGVANAKLLFIGDSTMAGYSAETNNTWVAARASAVPDRVASLLTGAGFYAKANSYFGDGSNQNTANWLLYDPRFTAGAGWANTSFTANFGGSYPFNSTTTNDLVFTPPVLTGIDTYEVYYIKASGYGTFTINGANSTNANAAAGIGKVTATVTAGTACTIARTGVGGQVIITGIVGYNSAQKEISIYNAGVGSAKAVNISRSANVWEAVQSMTLIAPDLTVINMSINDAIASTSTVTYTSQMQTAITTALLSGDVIMVTQNPTAIPLSGGNISLEAQKVYVDIVKDLAETNGVPVVDIWGGWRSYERLNPLGYYTDATHPGKHGYMDIAESIFKFILTV